MAVVLVVVSVVVVSVVVVSVVVVSVVVISVVVSVVNTAHVPGGSSRGWQRGTQQQHFGKVLHNTDPWVKVPGPQGTEKHHDIQEPTTSSSHCPRGQDDLQEHPVAAHGHHRGSGQCHLGGWHWLCCPALQTPPHSGVTPPCQELGNNPPSPDKPPCCRLLLRATCAPLGPHGLAVGQRRQLPGGFPAGASGTGGEPRVWTAHQDTPSYQPASPGHSLLRLVPAQPGCLAPAGPLGHS